MRKSCHNCRRLRLRCDLSVPSCRKCFLSGKQCLGYGKLYTWNNGVASRGKMMGKSFELSVRSVEPGSSTDSSVATTPNNLIEDDVVRDDTESVDLISEFQLRPSLLDPLVQDLSYSPRYYLSHCKQFCETKWCLADRYQFVADYVKILSHTMFLVTTLIAIWSR